MPEFASLIGFILTVTGAVWLIVSPRFAPAAVLSAGLGLVGWSPLLGVVAFSLLGGLILLFGNPYRRRTSISTGRPEGERTGSSPSNTP